MPATCASIGATCGLAPDGCGGVLSCGTCSGSDVCGGGGAPNTCGPNACTPDRTCATNACGLLSDGCAGVVDCGGCSGSDWCGGGGTANVCGCNAVTCADVGATCGSVPDGCGGTLNCGSCSGSDVCGGGGFDTCGPNTCVPLTCAGKNCGDISDGCGNILHCGDCSAPETCGGGLDANVCGCPDGCASVSSIDVSPASSTLTQGGSEQLDAIAWFSNGAAREVTAISSWSSSDLNVAAVSLGLVSASGVGSADLSASWSGASGAASVAVQPALVSMQVTPGQATIGAGYQQTFMATGFFSDGSSHDVTGTAGWSSSDGTVARVSGGVATGLAGGSATITAAIGTISASANLTVIPATLLAISITPSQPTIAIGTNVQFTATGIFSDQTLVDMTSQVTWTTSSAKATMLAPGLFEGVAAGQATITATDGSSGLSDSTLLTVSNVSLVALDVFPTTPQIAHGTTLQFMAVGTFSDQSTQDLSAQVTWSSSDTTVATIENGGAQPGLALGITAGTSTIAAALNGFSGSTTLTVTNADLVSIAITPANPRIAMQTNVQLTATGTFTDGTTQDLTHQAAWASSDPNVADVSNALGTWGLVTSYTPGTSDVSASLMGVTGSTTVTVTNSTLVSIAVVPSAIYLPIHTQLQLHAVGTFSDGSTQDITTVVAWSSSNTQVAAVSNAVGSQGLLQSNGQGSAVITATRLGITGTANVTVKNYRILSVAVVPNTASMHVGDTLQLQAIGTYDDGTGGTITLDITQQAHWQTSSKSLATVTPDGLVKAVAATPAGAPADITAWKIAQTADCFITIQ